MDVFLLFFLHVGSRRVFLADLSARPDAVWVRQQAQNAVHRFAAEPIPPQILLRDYDAKFTAEFDGILQSAGVVVKKVGPRAPDLNAHIERWGRSLQEECLDHFVVFGEDHLRYLVDQYLAHYHLERHHQALQNETLTPPTFPLPGLRSIPDGVGCAERLGGLLKHFYLRAG